MTKTLNELDSARKSVSKILETDVFEKFVLTVILINSITLGLETMPRVMSQYSHVLSTVDQICLWIFSIEVLLKIFALGSRSLRDPWNLFDFFVVGISWLPSAGIFAIVRSLRILRALRIISTVPRLRKVVTGLLNSLPGLGAVSAIIALLFYVGAVIATKLFAATFPQWFGSLGSSLYTLFQIMTLESWSMGIVRPVMELHSYAWTFFVPFILVTTFTTLNLLIAVLVTAMQAETEEIAESRAQAGHDERVQIMEDLKVIRAQLAKVLERST